MHRFLTFVSVNFFSMLFSVLNLWWPKPAQQKKNREKNMWHYLLKKIHMNNVFSFNESFFS